MDIFEVGGLVLVNIPKESIRTKDLSHIKNFVNTLTLMKGKKARRTISICFPYDDVPEEVYEIPEVREWVSLLFKEMPYVLYYIDTTLENDKTLMVCHQDFSLFYKGIKMNSYERIASNRLFEQINTIINIPEDNLQRMYSSILEHGEKLNDKTGAEEVIEDLKRTLQHL